MQIYEELRARGLIAQVTDEEEIRELVNNGKATFYIGFDPTADSLHVGHFMALCLMKRLQMAGNRPVVLVGGGTGYIGDPSGRTDMRSMMTPETIQHNCDCFKKQMERFIDFGEGKAIMVNNADWLLKLNYIDLLRDVGACFSVNNMLRAECYKQRMEKGLSFLEFNYMIMQSYDFYHLFQEYGCNMQFGGDDQWSNMLGGTELIRRKLGEDAYAMTITLLMNSEGKKMGKTASGAVWLDPNKTSPYEFYQYWRNVGDNDVLKCIRMLTFLPLEEIDKMDAWEGAQLNTAKEILAFELTKLVHGEEEAKKAQETARGLLGLLGFFFSVDQLGQLKGQDLLGGVQLCALPGVHLVDLFQRQEGEHPNALEHIVVAHIAPILVELVGRGLVGVQPHCAGGGLAHLLALGVHEQRDGHGIGILAQLAADELGTAEHVGPLVIAAELHVAAVFLEEMVKVIGLHDHVVELQEGQPLLHALLVALSPQHIVDREAGAHVPQEVDVVELEQPVGVVHHDGLALAKVNEPLHLLLKAVAVVLDGLGRHHGAHIRAPGGVADVAGAAAHQDHRPVPCHLQALHQAQGHEVAHMEAVGGGVKADIKRGLAVVDQLPDLLLVGDLGNEPAGSEFFVNLHVPSPFLLGHRGNKNVPCHGNDRGRQKSWYHLYLPSSSRKKASASLARCQTLRAVTGAPDIPYFPRQSGGFRQLLREVASPTALSPFHQAGVLWAAERRLLLPFITVANVRLLWILHHFLLFVNGFSQGVTTGFPSLSSRGVNPAAFPLR